MMKSKNLREIDVINKYINQNITAFDDLDKLLVQLSNLTNFLISINFPFDEEYIDYLLDNQKLEKALDFVTDSLAKDELFNLIEDSPFSKIMFIYYNNKDNYDEYEEEEEFIDDKSNSEENFAKLESIMPKYYGNLPAVLTKEEEVDLFKRMQAGDKEAYNKLVEHNIKLVISIAKRYQKQDVSLPDLIQEGNIGLLKAIERFDVTRGNKFSTYAIWWIRQSIMCFIEDNAKTIRLPRYKLEEINKLKKFTNEYLIKNGNMPSISKTSRELGIPEGTIKEIINNEYTTELISLNSPAALDADSELMEFIYDDKLASPEDQAIANELPQKVQELLTKAKLTDREKEIILRRNGFNGRIETLEEIGEKMGVTRERIRQIEQKAMNKLKNNRYAQDLKIYIVGSDSSKTRALKK